jgi:hypothetical protein
MSSGVGGSELEALMAVVEVGQGGGDEAVVPATGEWCSRCPYHDDGYRYRYRLSLQKLGADHTIKPSERCRAE